MTTITAEELGKSLTDKITEALKKGALFITAGGRTLRVEEVDEPLTENGLTELEERALLKAIKEGEADYEAGRYTTVRNREELQSFLDSL